MKHLLILPILFTLFALPAYAQDDTRKTRREKIVHDLVLESETVEDAVVKDEAKDVTDLGLRGRSSDNTKLGNLLDAIAAEIVAPKTQAKPKKVIRKIAPFYLSTQDYLDERGDETGQQLVLHYEVASGAASGAGLGTIKDVELILGEDFAAMQVDKNLTIYDFKFDRILTIKPEYNMEGKTTGELLFENTSLYAKVYRDVTLVRRSTNNGRLKKLDMGQDTTLDAYWVESAMSWAGGNFGADIEIKETGAALKINRDGVAVFSAKFSNEDYKNSGSKNSLFAFAHHEWPLHPAVLSALYAYDAPPKWFEMLSYGPTALKGQKQVWTLVKREDIDAVFPLPPSATGTAQGKNVSPLAFLMNEAAHNRALGGVKSVEDLTQDFNSKMDKKAYWQAWVVGQKYVAYSGGCKNPDDPTICKAVTRIEQSQKDDLPKRIQDYMTAVSYVDRKGQKEDTLTIIAPYLDKKETPAFIIRIAAMARAKMKPGQARETGFVSINAELLLQTALAKDPYDPNTYVGLAQVLAAKGAFEQSWDIYDALRAGLPTASSLDLKINRLEQNLRKTAPGYFLE
jgi:hypothetical protein